MSTHRPALVAMEASNLKVTTRLHQAVYDLKLISGARRRPAVFRSGLGAPVMLLWNWAISISSMASCRAENTAES